jgi:hypothetical protein
MLGTITTIERMEKKITLQNIADLITEKFNMLDGKINGVDQKFDGKFGILEGKINALDQKFTRKFNAMDQKLDRIEFTVNAIQKDNESIHGELKGIHKVLDKFNGRITRLEIHTGIPVEAAPVDAAEE